MARTDTAHTPGWVTTSTRSYSPAVRHHILRLMQRMESQHTQAHPTHTEHRDRVCIECTRLGWAEKKEHLDALFMLDISAGDAIYLSFSSWHHEISMHLDGRHYHPETSPVLGDAKPACPLCAYWVEKLGPDIAAQYADTAAA